MVMGPDGLESSRRPSKLKSEYTAHFASSKYSPHCTCSGKRTCQKEISGVDKVFEMYLVFWNFSYEFLIVMICVLKVRIPRGSDCCSVVSLRR
jgi:hypothetical protein